MGKISEIEGKKRKSDNHNFVPQNRTRDHSKAISTPADRTLFLQGTVGNQAVQRMIRSGVLQGNQQMQREPQHAQNEQADRRAELLTRASAEPGKSLDDSVRAPMERLTGTELGNIRVHAGKASEAAAESLGARAYTIGSNIHLGREASNGNETVRRHILAHEAVHTVQQGGREAAMQSKMRVSQPGDAAETEADHIAESILSGTGNMTFSPALALRDTMRATPVAACVQRDITGSQTWAHGKLEIDFKKKEGTVPGDVANEKGSIKFTPSATAPESDSIRFVQIVRTTDKSSGTETDYTWTGGEAARNSIRTARDNPRNIAPGFFVDQIHASQSKRTKKSDAPVLPYYDVTSPGTIGKRRGKTIVPATLDDTPGGDPPGRFIFVTSAKASDTGVWYGTVLWGFELYHDKKGVQKIKGEYRSFRTWQGETTDAALKAFDEYYRNPGASTAPKK